MRWFAKKITVPESNETKIADTIQLWYVSWYARHGAYYADTRREVEAFPTEAEANTFATSLRNAFRLIKHTSGTEVTVERAR